MDEERRPVEMVRLEREEEVYVREEVLGRDARSVFPTEAAAQGMDPDAVRELIGATNFITESELAKLKASRGERLEDGTMAAPLKSLAEVLAENKERKDQEFKAVWENMKRGKNRPLEEDEAEFLDALAMEEEQKERQARQQEDEELDAYREALRKRAEESSAVADEDGSDSGLVPTARLPDLRAERQQQQAAAAAAKRAGNGADRKASALLPAIRPRLKPVVRPVVKRQQRPPTGSSASSGGDGEQGGGSTDGSGPAAKRSRMEGAGSGGGGGAAAAAAASAAGAGSKQDGGEGSDEGQDVLGGLLGDYGSDGSDGSGE